MHIGSGLYFCLVRAIGFYYEGKRKHLTRGFCVTPALRSCRFRRIVRRAQCASGARFMRAVGFYNEGKKKGQPLRFRAYFLSLAGVEGVAGAVVGTGAVFVGLSFEIPSTLDFAIPILDGAMQAMPLRDFWKAVGWGV